tara:strand:+ start:202 stop:408 length:207 start_codon:yes stop_codon:yes gene_type:complete
MQGVYMKLKDYLVEHDISTPKFAKKTGVKLTTMNSYRYDVSIPNKKNMIKIYKASNKMVKPNDFYELY